MGFFSAAFAQQLNVCDFLNVLSLKKTAQHCLKLHLHCEWHGKKPASPAEQQTVRKHITVGDLLDPLFASISEVDENLQLTLDEFPQTADSTVRVSMRAQGSKSESAF